MTEDEAGYLFEVDFNQRRDIGHGLEEVQLGGPGQVWLVYSLFGGHTLSRAVLDLGRMFEHDSGSTFTICPYGARASHLLDFSAGSIGISTSAMPNIHRHLAERCDLGRYLLVSDDPVASPTDPWLSGKPGVRDRTFSSGNELYHWRRPSDSEEGVTALADLLRWTGDYPMNAFAIDEPADSGIGPRSEVSPDSLRELAMGVRAVITGAYDAQGFVVWVAA